MRYTGPKNRLARREGMDLGLKTLGSKSQTRLLSKLNVLPGQHGTRGRKKMTEYGQQLREKQKLRYMFGITEKKLKRYFEQSSKKKGNTALYLSEFLESRLDNIVYRLGFAPTRAAARQLVAHGHIKVGDTRITIPSYQVKKGGTIVFASEKTTKISYIEKSLMNQDAILPKWLEKKATLGRLVETPTNEEIAKQINLRLIIEFYSR